MSYFQIGELTYQSIYQTHPERVSQLLQTLIDHALIAGQENFNATAFGYFPLKHCLVNILSKIIRQEYLPQDGVEALIANDHQGQMHYRLGFAQECDAMTFPVGYEDQLAEVVIVDQDVTETLTEERAALLVHFADEVLSCGVRIEGIDDIDQIDFVLSMADEYGNHSFSVTIQEGYNQVGAQGTLTPIPE